MAKAPAARRREQASLREPIANRCPDGQALDTLAESASRIADALEELRPTAEVVRGFGERLDKLCEFLRRRGPWLLAAVPLVLTAINALSPEAARALGAVISALGGVPAAPVG